MKRLVSPFTVLFLGVSVFGLACGNGWLWAAAESPQEQVSPVDPYSTEVAYRHRTCQPNHWRGMMMRN